MRGLGGKGLVTAAAWLVLVPVTAPAATVRGRYHPDIHDAEYSDYSLVDTDGERNDIEVTEKGYEYYVRERGPAPLRAEGNCRTVRPQVVRCDDADYAAEFVIRLGGGDDAVRVATDLGPSGGLRVHGQAGDDRLELDGGYGDLYGGPGRDVLIGGSRRNSLYGGGGRDVLRGMGGDDVLGGDLTGSSHESSSAHDDSIDGGSGDDFVSWEPRPEPVSVDLRQGVGGSDGERDTLHSIEGVVGGTGDDELRGGPGPDTLQGGPGADLLNGRDGDDVLDGGLAAYTWVGPADGSRDRIECGPGQDLATGVVAHRKPPGKADAVPQSCEWWSIDGTRNAVPRLRTGSRTLRVEQTCKTDGLGRCRRTVIALSGGEELGRSKTAVLTDRRPRTLEVPLAKPLEPGRPIDLVVEGENRDEDSSTWHNHDHLMRLRWP